MTNNNLFRWNTWTPKTFESLPVPVGKGFCQLKPLQIRHQLSSWVWFISFNHSSPEN